VAKVAFLETATRRIGDALATDMRLSPGPRAEYFPEDAGAQPVARLVTRVLRLSKPRSASAVRLRTASGFKAIIYHAPHDHFRMDPRARFHNRGRCFVEQSGG
jgi:hypothetical protein